MKKFVLYTVLGLLTTALALQAAPQQNRRQQGREINVDQRVSQMQQNLNLTPEQTDKVRSILQSENDKIRNLTNNQNQSSDRSANAKEIRQIRQDTMKQVESVLTKEQIDKLHQQRANRNQQGK